MITSNATHAWNWKLCESVTVTSYDAAAGRIANDQKNPPEYALFKFNCTNWIFRIAAKAFVTLPSANSIGKDFFDPEVLGGKLKDLWVEQGSRNIPGGKVFRNSNNVSPTDAADPPSPFATDSYSDLALDAFSNPVALGHNMDMAVARRRLSALRVGVGRDLVVSLLRVTLARRSRRFSSATVRARANSRRSLTPTGGRGATPYAALQSLTRRSSALASP